MRAATPAHWAMELVHRKKFCCMVCRREREIRPALRKDGGDIELIDVDGDFVMVSLRGACVSCKKSQTTLKEYVEKKLREQVLDTLIVEEGK